MSGYNIGVPLRFFERWETLQAVEVHVIKGEPALIFVDKRKRGAGDDGIRTYSQAECKTFGKPCFATSQLPRQGDHIPL